MIVAILVGLTSMALANLLGSVIPRADRFQREILVDEKQAIDGAAAWSFWDEDGFQLHVDYPWHNWWLNLR
jgi:hypothetical protein